jgi:tRNA-Thr(GGU) m(6)t(6)A37 methyltransferase TsaA
MDIAVTPIGVIHSPFSRKDDTPVQGAFASDAEGTVVVYESYAEGLKDVESFSHLILLYLFDRAGEVRLVRPTFLDDEAHGVFASRHPCRPNGIGLTVVRLLGRSGNRLQVAGLDVLDQTPLLVIKPYVPRFDCRPEASEGWLAGKRERPKPTGRE